MEAILDYKLIMIIVGAVIIMLIYYLHPRISSVSLPRLGLEIHTNDSLEMNKIGDRIREIDSQTHRSIRKATVALQIIDPESYDHPDHQGLYDKAMIVVRDANQQLVFAAYENNHAREIAFDNGKVYLSDKTQDIAVAVQTWKKYFPELTEEVCDSFACHWFRKVVAPTVRKACLEKVAYYTLQIDSSSISKPLSEMLMKRRTQNLEYITKIDALCKNEDITERSTIFMKGLTS